MERLASLRAPEWIEAFQHHLLALGVQMDADSMFDMAVEIHSTRGNLDPADEARTEWDMWPPEAV
jgi:hypothetical protein